MNAALMADAVLVAHLGFVLFVVLGGVLVLRWPRLLGLHLAALAWGVTVEWAGLVCPLTALENTLRHRAGQTGYTGGFIDHTLTALLYPEGLTRGTQWMLGAAVLVINAVVYTRLARRLRHRAVQD